MKRIIYILSITILTFLCGCNKCESSINRIEVKYDSFSECRFRSVSVSEYDSYLSDYNDTIIDKCLILDIVKEINHVTNQTPIDSAYNIDVRMRLSIIADSTHRDVYMDMFHLVDGDHCYHLPYESLLNIVSKIDKAAIAW
jgi:hypothetical protein